MKWYVALLLLVAGLASVAAERVFVDDAGNRVVVADKPGRIVSLALFCDEMVLDLVPASRVQAVTSFVADALVSNVATKAKAVPHKIPFNVETIVALRPDLVLAASWSDAAKLQQLRDLRIPLFVMKTPVSLQEVRRQLGVVAALCAEPAAGAALLKAMDARLSRVQQLVAAVPVAKRPRALEYNRFGTAAGAGSSWDEVLGLAGFVNPLRSRPSDSWGMVPVSRELLFVEDPDYLVISDWMYDNQTGPQALKDELQRDAGFATLKAVRQGRILQVPARLKETTSHYMVDAVEFMVAELARFAGIKP